MRPDAAQRFQITMYGTSSGDWGPGTQVGPLAAPFDVSQGRVEVVPNYKFGAIGVFRRPLKSSRL